jgi:hypothetical protein
MIGEGVATAGKPVMANYPTKDPEKDARFFPLSLPVDHDEMVNEVSNIFCHIIKIQ